jgi:acetylornithine deacetylase/succinyl-diaminopimelate desuccinylase-like protein
LPGETPEHVLQTLKQVLADDRISVTPTEPSSPTPPSPLSPEVIDAVQQAKEKLWPQLPFVAEMETGASDGVYFRKSGIPTYGISGIAVDIEDNRAHGKDERVAVADFYSGLEFEYQLLKAIASTRAN